MEGGYSPENARQFQLNRETTGRPPENEGILLPAEPLTEAEIIESQNLFAVALGYESWERVKPLERAEFWVGEGEYKEAEREGIKAGLSKQGQLRLMIKATENRLVGLSRDPREEKIKEFYRIDALRQGLITELTKLTTPSR